MLGYRSKLARDIEHWRENGWLDGDAARAILKDVDSRGVGLGLAPILGILAATLLSFAAMSFVAANWDEMSKLSRLGLIFTALGGSYVAAWMFKERGMAFFSEAAILLGCGLFGANIMMVAQMYHMEGNPPDAVLLWAAGSLLAALLLNARSALGLAIILFTLWSVWQGSLTHEIHIPYIPVWIGLGVLSYRMGWKPAYHMLTIAMIFWVISQFFNIRVTEEFQYITALGVGVAALAFFAKDLLDRHLNFDKSLLAYGLTTAFVGSIGWQFLERKIPTEMLLMLAIVTLGTIIAVIFYAARQNDNKLLWLGYVGFSIEILMLYFKTLGDLIGTSLFFLIAGLIVSALAYFAYRLHQHQQADGEADI